MIDGALATCRQVITAPKVVVKIQISVSTDAVPMVQRWHLMVCVACQETAGSTSGLASRVIGTGYWAVTLCDWEVNRRPGVALDLRYRLQ